MSEPRKIKTKLVNFTSCGSIIAHGEHGEHVILELGSAQVLSLRSDVNKYADYYKLKEEPSA